MKPINLLTRLDHIEDGAYLARSWAEGGARLDGWQLEYAARVYGVSRVPEATLRRCLAWSQGEQCAFYKGTRKRDKETVFKFFYKLKKAINEEE